MAIKGLTIIGESINDSVPSTQIKFENKDIEGILQLAEYQDKKGATYIDVNIGKREPGFMADLVKKIQEVTSKPLSIDTPDPEIAAAGLEAYNPAAAQTKMPILNSIAPTRSEMFDLYALQPFMPVLLLTERLDDNGEARMNLTADQTHASAK
ncbi:MAG: dihydropteroate synthase, partial [bacterium]